MPQCILLKEKLQKVVSDEIMAFGAENEKKLDKMKLQAALLKVWSAVSLCFSGVCHSIDSRIMRSVWLFCALRSYFSPRHTQQLHGVPVVL